MNNLLKAILGALVQRLLWMLVDPLIQWDILPEDLVHRYLGDTVSEIVGWILAGGLTVYMTRSVILSQFLLRLGISAPATVSVQHVKEAAKEVPITQKVKTIARTE